MRLPDVGVESGVWPVCVCKGCVCGVMWQTGGDMLIVDLSSLQCLLAFSKAHLSVLYTLLIKIRVNPNVPLCQRAEDYFLSIFNGHRKLDSLKTLK